MSEVTIAKLIYGTIALLAAITVGIVVAVFLAVLRFCEVLISFPLEIYRSLVNTYKARLMMEAFSVQESSGEEEEERSNSDKMWDRHIERMNKKNKNI
jgi:flagellar biosynthesis protein FliQ